MPVGLIQFLIARAWTILVTGLLFAIFGIGVMLHRDSHWVGSATLQIATIDSKDHLLSPDAYSAILRLRTFYNAETVDACGFGGEFDPTRDLRPIANRLTELITFTNRNATPELVTNCFELVRKDIYLFEKSRSDDKQAIIGKKKVTIENAMEALSVDRIDEGYDSLSGLKMLLEQKKAQFIISPEFLEIFVPVSEIVYSKWIAPVHVYEVRPSIKKGGIVGAGLGVFLSIVVLSIRRALSA